MYVFTISRRAVPDKEMFFPFSNPRRFEKTYCSAVNVLLSSEFETECLETVTSIQNELYVYYWQEVAVVLSFLSKVVTLLAYPMS